MQKNAKIAVLLMTLILFSVLFYARRNTPAEYVWTGQTMGTTYMVKVRTSKSIDKQSIARAIDEQLAAVNKSMSTYDPESEISLFNANEESKKFVVSNMLFEVVAKAQEVAQQSAGAFDITVSPLVDLWGFGPEARPERLPDASTIADVKARVGYHLLGLDSTNSTLGKKHPKLAIDLSAIAKGYGVDQLGNLLEQLGLDEYLVEVGGEVRAGCPDEKADCRWRLAIEKPEEQAPSVQKILLLKNASLATSGSYRNYYEQDGRRYSHMISPFTGSPITHKLVSVSVLADDCMTADAWATALMVLGPERGLETANRYKIAAYFIEKENDFVVKESATWNSYLH